MNLPFEPRRWQADAALRFGALVLKRPNARALITAGTGSGKTKTFFLIGIALGQRFLFLTHTDALAEQVEREAKAAFPQLRVGVVKAARAESGADFVVASVATIAKQERLDDLVNTEVSHGNFAIIGVDEAHHAIADSVYDRVLKRFPDRPALGLTATAWRLDGSDLAAVWTDGICFRYTRQDATRDKVLVPIVDGRGGDKPHRILLPDVEQKAIIAAREAQKNGDVDAEKKAYGKHAWPTVAKEIAFVTNDLGRRIIGFTPDCESARQTAEYSRQLGVEAEAVDGSMGKRELKKIMRAHRDGKVRALLNAQLLLEGYDDKGVDGVIFARATASFSLYWQAIGRGLRSDVDSNKQSCYVGDFVGAHDAHSAIANESLFTGEATPDLPDSEVEAIGNAAKEAPPDKQTALWAAFLSCLSGRRLLVSGTRGPRVAWLPLSAKSDAYAYGGADGATYLIEQAGGGLWTAIREPRERGVPALRLCVPQSLQEAQAVAERAARAGESFDARDAGWREEAASEKVRAALEKWRVPVPDKITRGEASDALVISVAKMKRRDRYKRGIIAGGGCFP